MTEIPSLLLSYIVQTRFKTNEVFSRKWTDSDGRPIEYLGQTNLLFGSSPGIMAASYGDKSSRKVSCVDFYAGDMQDESGAFLMCHEIGPGVVTSIETERKQARRYVVIRRQFVDPQTSKKMEATISYEIVNDLLMIQSPHQYLSPIE